MLFAVAIENNTNTDITRKNNSPKINAKAVDKEDHIVKQTKSDNIQQITHNGSQTDVSKHPQRNATSKECILNSDKKFIPCLKKRLSCCPSPYKPFDVVTPTPMVTYKGNTVVS